MVEYYYSCYGYNIKTIDNSNMSLSTINPYRYRSYYQDNETGWYYLNSRYYDSNTCRFISMDNISYLGASNTINSYNLFTYCEGNPVMFVDTSGKMPIGLFSSNYANIIFIYEDEEEKEKFEELWEFLYKIYKNDMYKRNYYIKLCGEYLYEAWGDNAITLWHDYVMGLSNMWLEAVYQPTLKVCGGTGPRSVIIYDNSISKDINLEDEAIA